MMNLLLRIFRPIVQFLITYWKNLKLFNIIIGVIILKLATLLIAYVLCLDVIFKNDVLPLNIFFTQDINYVSNILIILLVLYKIVFTPLKKVPSYLVTLVCNIIIINIILILFLSTINLSGFFDFYIILNFLLAATPFSIYGDVSVYEDNFMFLGEDTSSIYKSNQTDLLNNGLSFKSGDESTGSKSPENSNGSAGNSSADVGPSDRSRPGAYNGQQIIRASVNQISSFTNQMIIEAWRIANIPGNPPIFKVEQSDRFGNVPASTKLADGPPTPTEERLGIFYSRVAEKIGGAGYDIIIQASDQNLPHPTFTDAQEQPSGSSLESSSSEESTIKNKIKGKSKTEGKTEGKSKAKYEPGNISDLKRSYKESSSSDESTMKGKSTSKRPYDTSDSHINKKIRKS